MDYLSFMRIFTTNIAKRKREIKGLSAILIIFLIIAGVYFYNATYYVIVRFDELGPLTKNMSAYYNGFKVGKIVRIGPDIDFKHTLVKVNLTQKDFQLPQNTVVNVERFPNGELYLQFIYPSSPSFRIIKRGDILEGTAPYSLEQFMRGQNISGVTDVVSIHVIQALQATEIANQEMTNFFKNTSKIVTENSKGIKKSVDNTAAMTKSLAQMAENLNQASQKINNAIDEATLKDTTSNVKDSTSNMKTATENIANATKDIDKTMKKIDDTVSQANEAAAKLNAVTNGLHGTLSKRLGGMRVMFGTPIRAKN